MKQDLIVILDLGSTQNTVIAREIRDLGVYSEIHPHDITVDEVRALQNVKGIVLNGGENRVVDGQEVEISPELYNLGIPMLSIDYPQSECEKKLSSLPDQETLKKFIFEECGAEANWNMKNFIEDQVELIRQQVGDKKVLLALSGGVDSSVVAAMLIKAIGQQLVCVHVNHGLMRKNESESVVKVFRDELHANLIYVDASERFLGKLENVAEQIYLAPSYFGVLFKKEVGESFSCYLTSVRIEKAKELLHDIRRVFPLDDINIQIRPFTGNRQQIGAGKSDIKGQITRIIHEKPEGLLPPHQDEIVCPVQGTLILRMIGIIRAITDIAVAPFIDPTVCLP